jgi:hypothetical protein
MKTAVILILTLTISVHGQQRNSTLDVSLPTPGSTGTVTLSLSEYNHLMELAARKPKPHGVAPIASAVTHAAFRLRVEGQSLFGDVDFEGSLLGKGSIKVPLTSGLTVLEARQSGSPLPLLQEGSTHAAILNGPGPFVASLSIAAPLTIEAGRASFMLPVPAASSSTMKLELPGNHANVRIEPGLITGRTALNGRTFIEATLEPGKPVRVWWTTREVGAPVAQRELRFLSDIKTVISIGDSHLRLTALCDLTVIQGEAVEFRMPLPIGFELTEVTGGTLESSETEGGVVVLKVREPSRRNHQFLIQIERSNREEGLDAPFLAMIGAQRETGEILVEGVGAMELTPKESGGLRRIDVREAGALTKSLTRSPLQAAFRYNRRQGDTPGLKLDWKRFPDGQVLSAIAERATVTTLMNAEGRSLTEVTLRVRNHAQPFVKVELPAGAQLLSAEVEGERVKPVLGTDGSRVPLLRAGLDTSGAYTVSFVYLSSGDRFAKRGLYGMGLPRLDIPVNILTWEVSLPDRLQVKQFGGNALAAELFPAAAQNAFLTGGDLSDNDSNLWAQAGIDINELAPGQVGGIVVDPNGAVIAGAAITLNNRQNGQNFQTRSDSEGQWVISNVPPGAVNVTITAPGFKVVQQDFEFTASQPARLGTTLDVGGVSETVSITSTANTVLDGLSRSERARKNQAAQLNAPSQNVFNLQKRVAGILPVRVEVPRSGKSYHFIRPLVLEEETRITFEYRSK